MNTSQTLQLTLENHLTRFLDNVHDNPEMLEKIAHDVVSRGEELMKDYPAKTQLYHEAAIEIVQVMSKGAYMLDLFTQAIYDENIEAIAPGKFLTAVDDIPDIDPVKSNEIIQTVAQALEHIASEQPTIPFGAIFYENYFGEYIANIFHVSAIESLYENAELFKNLKALLNKKRQSDEIYAIFQGTTDQLQRDLASRYFSYEEIRKILP